MAMALFTQKDIDAVIEEEQARWCERLNFLHTEYGADCSGCDSSDPLDCVEVEIRQAIESAKQQGAKEACHIISKNTLLSGISMAIPAQMITEIKETFGLEI